MGGNTTVAAESAEVELVSLDDNQSVETKVESQYNGPVSPSTLLRRNWWSFAFFLPYAAGAIIAWVIVCIQTIRPLNATQYNFWQGRPLNVTDYYFDKDHFSYEQYRQQFATNQAWYHAARVGQSILAVFTIPLTSAICAYAAVVFAQAPRGSLTMQQTMALSDRAWTDPMAIAKLFKRLRSHGSSLLLSAIMINLIGIVVPPLQAILTTPISIKGSGNITLVAVVNDPTSILRSSSGSYDDNSITLFAKTAVSDAFSDTLQPNLWDRQGQTSSQLQWIYSTMTGGTQNNMNNFSTLVDPFYAPLASGTHTGLITQYLPRLNSSAKHENITAAEWPANCTADGAYLVQYNHTDPAVHGLYTGNSGNWGFVACMPAMQNHTLWSVTRNRQDISEVLYLNISMFSGIMPGYPKVNGTFVGLYKITLNTTMGMFELPNYANDGVPGPLLSQDPLPDRWDPQNLPDQYQPFSRRGIDNATEGISNSTIALQSVQNKGPLLTLAMALFGTNSFLYNRFHNPYQYVVSPADLNYNRIASNVVQGAACFETQPLLGLMFRDYQTHDDYLPAAEYNKCLKYTTDVDEVHLNTEAWLLLFSSVRSDIIANAFEAAAFLTLQAWYDRGVASQSIIDSYIEVTADMGQDTTIPYISRTGKIIVSVLLAIYLLSLLALCFYASLRPTWTPTLDSFAMMRIGASSPDDLPLKCAPAGPHLDVLSSPGWIGDASEGEGRVGALALGASGALNRRRLMQAYEHAR